MLIFCKKNADIRKVKRALVLKRTLKKPTQIRVKENVISRNLISNKKQPVTITKSFSVNITTNDLELKENGVNMDTLQEKFLGNTHANSEEFGKKHYN